MGGLLSGPPPVQPDAAAVDDDSLWRYCCMRLSPMQLLPLSLTFGERLVKNRPRHSSPLAARKTKKLGCQTAARCDWPRWPSDNALCLKAVFAARKDSGGSKSTAGSSPTLWGLHIASSDLSNLSQPIIHLPPWTIF